MGLLAVVAATVLSAAACTNSASSGGSATPSTFGGGSPWLGAFATSALPAPVNSLTDVACATASGCWAVGSTVGGAGAPNGAAVIATSNGGATWSNQVIPTAVGYLSRVACSDQRHCTAVGQATQTSDGQAVSIATADGGATWSLESVPPGILDLTAVTCRPDRSCTAVGTTPGGTVALTSTGPAAGWKQAGPLPPGMSGATGISCTTADKCWTTGKTTVDADHVAGTVAVTTDGGAAWATVATPKGLGALDGVSCLQGAATGAGAVPTTTAATTATTTATAPAAGQPQAGVTTTTVAPTTTAPAPIVGVSGARCVVVGTTATTLDGTRSGHGVLLTTENGGATWSSHTVSPASAGFAGVSCTAVGTCVTVGTTDSASPSAGLIVLTGQSGNPWGTPAVLASPQALTAVSCIAVSACVVVGESISEHLAGG